MNNEAKFYIKDDKIIRFVPMPQFGENMGKYEVIMDKETFVKAYREWILGEDTND